MLPAAIAAVLGLLPLAGASPLVPRQAPAMPTPMMGWSSWNTFECGIDEGLIRSSADAMVTRGFRDAGYNFVNVDDCWAADTRAPGPGPIRPSAAFPSGMRALGDYIHGLGMRFGIYSSAGQGTCAARAASLWQEDQDAWQFHDWGVDFLKYDNCDQYVPDAWSYPHPDNRLLSPQDRFARMGLALERVYAQTGRRIIFGQCSWGLYQEWFWASEVSKAHKWRIAWDIGFCWDWPCAKTPVVAIWDALSSLPAQGADLASPSRGFNDLDMLAVGVPGSSMSWTEDRSHFTMWAVAKSPLVLGCDVRSVAEDRRGILTNGEVIAVNQDPLGQPARRVMKDGGAEIWAGALSGDRAVVMLLNRDGWTRDIRVDFPSHLSQIPWGFSLSPSNAYSLRDLWSHSDLGFVPGGYSAAVEPHGVVLLVVSHSAGSGTPSAGGKGEGQPCAASGPECASGCCYRAACAPRSVCFGG